jgi:hypothetical protein
LVLCAALTTAAVLSGCSAGRGSADLEASAGERDAPSSDVAAPADEAVAPEDVAAPSFCVEFSDALVLRSTRIVEYLDQARALPPTSIPDDQVMGEVFDAAGGMIVFTSEISIDLLNSLTRPLPADIAGPAETALAIHQIYVDGAIPSEDQIDTLGEANDAIAQYVNDECGLDVVGGEL